MSGSDTELSGTDTSRRAASHPDWLDPEAALTAFQPPEGEALVTGVGEAQERRYGFRVASVAIVLKSGVYSEVVRDPDIAPIPHSPHWLLGLINLRSNLVPVFDLQELCGLGSSPTNRQSMLLVIGKGESTVAVPIAALPISVARLRRISPLPPLPEALRGFVENGYSTGDDVWFELDHEQFFLSVARKQ